MIYLTKFQIISYCTQTYFHLSENHILPNPLLYQNVAVSFPFCSWRQTTFSDASIIIHTVYSRTVVLQTPVGYECCGHPSIVNGIPKILGIFTHTFMRGWSLVQGVIKDPSCTVLYHLEIESSYGISPWKSKAHRRTYEYLAMSFNKQME